MNWKKKLSSRKFWAAISGVVISVMLAEGGADKAAVKKDDKTDKE